MEAVLTVQTDKELDTRPPGLPSTAKHGIAHLVAADRLPEARNDPGRKTIIERGLIIAASRSATKIPTVIPKQTAERKHHTMTRAGVRRARLATTTPPAPGIAAAIVPDSARMIASDTPTAGHGAGLGPRPRNRRPTNACASASASAMAVDGGTEDDQSTMVVVRGAMML